MNETEKEETATGKLGSVIGKGLIAGLAGTAAITLSQTIEMKITHRPSSFAPADAASKALGIEASTRENRKKFSNEVHWTYGTLWGMPRGILSLIGIKGWPATAIHLAAIFYTALTIEPDFEVAPPIEEWSKKEIAMAGFHHAVYAVAAGLVFDAISNNNKK
ncbi:MAG: hypothetical protein ABI172_06950 [Ginsengibacter sp.]